MRSLALLFILFATVAQAKTFDLAYLNGSRRTIVGSDGAKYIQLKPEEITPQLKADIYEAYRAKIREIIAQPKHDVSNQMIFQSENETGPKKKFVGFELPAFAQMYGTASNDESKNNQPINTERALMAYRAVTVDTDSRDGAVFVPSCRNPQGPLEISDPMNARILECYPSLMVFLKFRQPN